MKRTFIYIGCLLMAAGTVATSCSEDETAELSSSIYPGNVEMVIPDEARQLIYTDKDLDACSSSRMACRIASMLSRLIRASPCRV